MQTKTAAWRQLLHSRSFAWVQQRCAGKWRRRASVGCQGEGCGIRMEEQNERHYRMNWQLRAAHARRWVAEAAALRDRAMRVFAHVWLPCIISSS